MHFVNGLFLFSRKSITSDCNAKTSGNLGLEVGLSPVTGSLLVAIFLCANLWYQIDDMSKGLDSMFIHHYQHKYSTAICLDTSSPPRPRYRYRQQARILCKQNKQEQTSVDKSTRMPTVIILAFLIVLIMTLLCISLVILIHGCHVFPKSLSISLNAKSQGYSRVERGRCTEGQTFTRTCES